LTCQEGGNRVIAEEFANGIADYEGDGNVIVED
jgi:hypothetical protein